MKYKEENQANLAEQLKAMRETDIRSVDVNSLVDIADVKITPGLSQQERVLEYIDQIKNPYCYLCNGVVVKISFAGKKSLEDCLKDAMFQET